MRIGRYYELPSLGDYALAGLKLLIFAAFIVLTWSLVNKITSFDDHRALFVEHNSAYALQRAGLVVAQAIGISSLISTRSTHVWEDLAWLVGGGFWVTGLLLLVRLGLSRLIPFATDAAHRTVSVGVARFGAYVASGLVMGAALTGSAPSLATALAATVVFTALGLACLLGVFYLNGAIQGFRLNERVEEGNTAAALVSGGFLIAVGLVLRNAIAGDFTGWASGLVGFLATALIAVMFFYALAFAVDRWIITHTTLAKAVAGCHDLVAAILAVAMISIALGVSTVAI